MREIPLMLLHTVTIVLIGLFWSGCAKQDEDGQIRRLIYDSQFNEALTEFRKHPSRETIQTVFKWCSSDTSIIISEFDPYEEPSIVINLTRVGMAELGDATREYGKELNQRHPELDFETLAALKGMIILGEALEDHEHNWVRILGMMMQAHALSALAKWATSRDYTRLHKALLRAQADLKMKMRGLVPTENSIRSEKGSRIPGIPGTSYSFLSTGRLNTVRFVRSWIESPEITYGILRKRR